MGQLLSLATGALSYLLFAGIGGFIGYFFAKKRTEHEVGYQRRVEVVERIQHLVVSLAAESWRCHRELERLPRRYGDPNFEREYERVGAELDWWLHTELAKAREGLTASFRAMLGVGRRPYELLRKRRRVARGR